MSTNTTSSLLISELEQNGIALLRNSMNLEFLTTLRTAFSKFWTNVQTELQKGNFTTHDKRYDWILDQNRFASIKELSTPAMKDTILCLGPGRHDVQLDAEEVCCFLSLRCCDSHVQGALARQGIDLFE
jgi:hypothetical protein